MTADDAIERGTAHYPFADLTAAEYERFVVDLFSELDYRVKGLDIQLLDTIEGVDGSYVFDATIRFTLAGMAFLVLVECKRHKSAIKRELVQTLHAKMQSVGAQKAVLIATAPFQRGAVTYATTHGIALANITEGRFTYETKAVGPHESLAREQARMIGIPDFVAHAYARTDDGGLTCTLVEQGRPDSVAVQLLALELDDTDQNATP